MSVLQLLIELVSLPSERAALETQRQDREEALISARAELKAIDLEEIDLESKIRAGNEEIKLRATQDEKVKEEMKNLKAGTWRNGNDGVKSLDVESHRVTRLA